MPLRLIKFGGAAITRDGCDGLFDRDNVRRIVRELGPEAHHCVLVHGTGLVGKRPAVEHDYIETGTLGAHQSHVAIQIRTALRELNGRVLDVLFEAGIRALPMDAWQCFGSSMEELRHDPLAASIRHATEQGLVPVFYGDFIPQPDGSFRVMSSDTMMLILARALRPDAALMLTAADGVCGQSEGSSPCMGAVMPILSESNRSEMFRSHTDKADVSGGMSAKVDHALDVAMYSGTCTIASGVVPGVVSALMDGKEAVCTQVVSERKSSVRKIGAMASLLLMCLTMLTGCMSPMGKFAGSLGDGLGRVPDRAIAKDGIPACILMIEGALSGSPDDPKLLAAAAGLYSFYGANVIEDRSSALRLTDRALDYALRAADSDISGIRQARAMHFAVLETLVSQTRAPDVPALFSLGSVWMDWIRVREDDMDAIGDLPRIEVLMERVVVLDAAYQAGSAHFYLALLSASLPEADAIIEDHFRRAIAMAKGQTLMPEVFYALWLSDNGRAQRGETLLRDIVARGLPAAPERTLVNQMALEKAQEALNKAKTAR